ncbi:hypothetical protein Trydic_g8612 [Trypoxylus dichotomus]
MEKLVGFLPDRDIFDTAFSLLEILGEYLHCTSKKIIAYRLFNVAVLTLLLVFVVGTLFESGSKNYVAIIEGVITVVHPLLKYLFFIRNKPYIMKLYDERFKIRWIDEDFPTSYLSAENRVLTLLRLTQLMLPFAVYVMVTFMLKPLIYRSAFIIETWMVDSIVVNTVVLALEYYLFVLIVPIVFSYDFIYLALCVDIVLQLKRINFRLQRLSKKRKNNGRCNGHDELIDLIKYHQLSLK